ncbi:heme NO-binding domain-containing protein [Labilibaculum antarcticum]|uniref:Heme transporter CcmB n=1 Tax=Labilibaculum antarcticum TaxID=1717717 RepID=A0A1Y1CJD9_9BACT|nr:heme NO-binding domain-containing protein [Labilibaculum antarcticum]BAX80455.1 heme transporter CcmB [Labilibaculum antarcticum]
MKGIVFREFLQMVEKKFGYNLVDQIIIDSKIESNGAYTSVGTYPHEELFLLVKELSKNIDVPFSQLLTVYGEYVFDKFMSAYPHLTEKYTDAFTLLYNIEDTIHVEVLKLYPDAQLPSILTISKTEQELILEYSSSRKMGDFAEGMITSCLKYFNEEATVKKEVLNSDQSKVLFTIKKTHGKGI